MSVQFFLFIKKVKGMQLNLVRFTLNFNLKIYKFCFKVIDQVK